MTDSIWARLSAPIDPARVAWRQDGKVATRKDGTFAARFVPYIEANTVRQRLDDVCPGWESSLTALTLAGDSDGTPMQAFKCCLTIHPDGLTQIAREDVGQGNDYKSAATDAFKRAAVRFGIGQELYDYDQLWVPMDSDGKWAKPLEDPGDVYARQQQKRKPLPPPPVQRPNPTTTSTGRPPSPAPSGVSRPSRPDEPPPPDDDDRWIDQQDRARTARAR